MATRITTFEVRKGIQGKLGFKVIDRRCSACGKEVPPHFWFRCPECGERFDDAMHDYAQEEG